jgi:hypothetical protein
MTQGLSVADVVSVSVTMSPVAAATRNFGALLLLGSTPGVIDTSERLRKYSTISGVASDFGTTAPEYLAANLYFAQAPQPSVLYVGAYAQTATAARLVGGILSASQQALSNFTAVTTGALKITIDGVLSALTAITFSGATGLNNVASILTTALIGKAVVVWNAVNQQFILTSTTTGSASTVAFAVTPSSGVDIAPLFNFRSTDGGRLAQGSAIETALAGVAASASISGDWYGLEMVPVTLLADSDRLSIATFIEAASPSRIYGITTQDSAVVDPAQTSDIASQLQAAKYSRTFVQYSSNTPHAVASLFGRAFTVDFTGNNTAITLKFKQEPGVTAETLSESQASALTAKNCNVFINYNNATAIIQQGVMSSGAFFDETQGLDWLQNAVQTAVFNLLYTSTTKIPQSDAGVNQIVATCEQSLSQAVTNGLLAPGVWNAAGFGALQQGQTLAKGYYIYAGPVANQSQSDRAARKSPTVQIAAKLAGAVHFVNVIISVNR